MTQPRAVASSTVSSAQALSGLVSSCSSGVSSRQVACRKPRYRADCQAQGTAW